MGTITNYSPYFLIALLGAYVLTACEKNASAEFQSGGEFPLSTLYELVPDKQQNELKKELRGKVLLINFWATWCSPCRREMPELEQLSNALDKDSFSVIGISVDEDKNLMREFLLQENILFPNYQDIDLLLSGKKLKLDTYPVTFIVSAEGEIIRRIVGEQHWNSKAIYSLLESINNETIGNETKHNRKDIKQAGREEN